MDMKKAPAIDTTKLNGSVTRMEFNGKVEDLRKELRMLSESVFSLKENNEIKDTVANLMKEVEDLQKQLAKIKKMQKVE